MAEPVEVSIEMDAPADEVYRLVADLPRMGEWSPECVRCDWTGGATGAVAGARFKGRNRIGRRRWTTTGTVRSAEPGRELAFDIDVGPLAIAGWGYRLEPTASGGCRVSESFTDRRGGFIVWFGGVVSGVSDRPTHNEAGMRHTLERLKAEAESARRG